MAYNDLDIPEMVNLFAPYILEPKKKEQFLAIVEIAGFYNLLVQAYEGVLSVRPPDTTKDETLKRISAAQRPIDYRHDRLASCGARAIECRIELALSRDPPDTAEADRWTAIFNAVYPDGTSIINRTYRAEAGNTLRLQDLLAKDENKHIVAALKSVIVDAGEKKNDPKRTLFDIIEQWIAAGAELGALETKKAERLAVLSAGPPPELRKVQAARSYWISIASTIVNALKLSQAPAAARAAISHPLESAAEAAGKRATGATVEEPDLPPAPPEEEPTDAAPPAPAAPAAPPAPPAPAAATPATKSAKAPATKSGKPRKR